MKRYLLIAMVALTCIVSFVFAEGTVSESPQKLGNPDKLVITWTSSTNEFVYDTTGYVRGEIKRVAFIPSTTAKPLAAYDITLKDANDIDILAGEGANLASNVNSTIAVGVTLTDGVNSNAIPFCVNDILKLTVTNCGSLKSGQVVLYYQP